MIEILNQKMTVQIWQLKEALEDHLEDLKRIREDLNQRVKQLILLM